MDKPAFPYCYEVQHSTDGEQRFVEMGLTRRELFAAMAMQGLRAAKLEGEHPRSLWLSASIAKLAVKDADALIAALDESK